MFGLGKDKTVQEGLYALSIALVIASLILAFSIVYAANTLAGNMNLGTEGNTAIQQQPTQQQPTQQQPQAAQISADDDAVKGSANAPVTIVEFSEFQCPYCGRFARDTLPDIQKNYVDTGKVKFVYRDFLVHTTSQKAQEAAECAGDQNKFWEYHDVLYQNQGALEPDDLKGYAAQVGLNTATFNSCLDSDKYASEVTKDTSDGRSYGVSGTPTFFINGVKLVGAQPYSAFEQAIDQALAG